MIDVYLKRTTYTDKAIISTLRVTSTRTAAVFSGFALENSHAGRLHRKKPTPSGDYPAKIRTDGKKGWRIELLHVPGHAHIEIHIGNFPRDSEGCFLPGVSADKNVVWDSGTAIKAIKSIVENDGSGKIMVHVAGENE